MNTSNVAAIAATNAFETPAKSQTSWQPEPKNFRGYNESKAKNLDEPLSSGAFAVIAIICLAIGAIALLT